MGQRPLPFEGRLASLDQHHLQLFVIQTEDDAVNGKLASGLFVRMWHGANFLVSDAHYR